jgi:hypothetical protein
MGGFPATPVSARERAIKDQHLVANLAAISSASRGAFNSRPAAEGEEPEADQIY